MLDRCVVLRRLVESSTVDTATKGEEMAEVLFEEIFSVESVDNQHFDKVSRLICKSENFEMQLILDINTDIYPMEAGEKFSLALASKINLDGSQEPEFYTPIRGPTLLDKYKYAMCGKIFDCPDSKVRRGDISVLASFGGLLMELSGDPRNLTKLELDMRVYLLLRPV